MRTLLVLLLLTAPLLAQTWPPQKTWVFMVGVLEWKDKATYASFPSADRRDAALLAQLQALGVPQDHTVYLQDRQATLAQIKSSYQQMLAKTRPGDWLIVYYCGHGFLSDQGKVGFANYDAGQVTWTGEDILQGLKQFPGDQAVLIADCCSSGGLAEAVDEAPPRCPTAVLAASDASESSTQDWTFTDAILEGLRGNGLEDANHDGWIDLAEIGRYAATDMASFHQQMAVFRGEPLKLVPSRPAPRDPRVGQRLEVKDEGDWYMARVVDAKGDQLKVRWVMAGYDTAKDDRWVPAAKTRPIPVKSFAKGAKVQVLWKGDWYPAQVLESRAGVHRVHYDGFEEVWDEWVSGNRIKNR